MKKIIWLSIILVSVILVSACADNQKAPAGKAIQTKYVCPNGDTVDSPSLCPKEKQCRDVLVPYEKEVCDSYSYKITVRDEKNYFWSRHGKESITANIVNSGDYGCNVEYRTTFKQMDSNAEWYASGEVYVKGHSTEAVELVCNSCPQTDDIIHSSISYSTPQAKKVCRTVTENKVVQKCD